MSADKSAIQELMDTNFGTKGDSKCMVITATATRTVHFDYMETVDVPVDMNRLDVEDLEQQIHGAIESWQWDEQDSEDIVPVGAVATPRTTPRKRKKPPLVRER